MLFFDSFVKRNDSSFAIDKSIKTWELDNVKSNFNGITCSFLNVGPMQKKCVVRYRKSNVTCFLVRRRGLYRENFKKTPKKGKCGISEEKISHRPCKEEKYNKLI